jgi:ribosome-associated toxin RatA of RatAB toxin-antitoxin module
MIKINKNREVSAPVDLVWDVISDMDNEQKYWPTVKDIKVLNRDGNTIEREATITRGPFGNAKSLQTVIIDPKEKSITVNMTKGQMHGTRKTTLDFLSEDKTKIEVAWEFEMKGVLGFALGWFVKDGVSKATEKALAKIAEDAESSESAKVRIK